MVAEQKSFEPELRSEYIEKLKKIDKEPGISFSNIEDLKKVLKMYRLNAWLSR